MKEYPSFSSFFIQNLKRIDHFGKPMPGFNLGGQTKVRSSLGGFFSLVAALILIVYALAKSSNLASIKGAVTSTFS